MADEIDYLDILILKKIDAESTVEKFGSTINTSFFETANLLGGMKIKGLIDIHSSIAGQSPLKVTTIGREVITEVTTRAGEPLNSLDKSILHALATGTSELSAVRKAINVRSKDLAYHLYKLKAYDYIDHSLRSGRVNFSLTEKGFVLTGGLRSSDTSKKEEQRKPVSKKEQEGFNPDSIDDEVTDLFDFRKAKEALLKPFRKKEKKEEPVSNIVQKPDEIKKKLKKPQFLEEKKIYSKKPKLDKTAMLLSKIEFYVHKYAIYAILLLIFFILMLYAIVFIALS